jgi:hypothetical protein
VDRNAGSAIRTGTHMTIDELQIAVRGYPISPPNDEGEPSKSSRPLPDNALVFDCETRTDAQQSLTFGSYRYYIKGDCIEEGLFYGEDLSVEEMACLKGYAQSRSADVKPPYSSKLYLRDRADFLRIFHDAAFKARAVVVGFNLPFDLSRIAFDVSEARGMFAGGFSLALWNWTRPDGTVAENKFRPRIVIKHIDSKRALKAFTKASITDKVDLIPEDAIDGRPRKPYGFRGHFLDLRTLAFALTDRGHSLESACIAFGVQHGKQKAETHGTITPEYIDYCRRDVLATAELYGKVSGEYGRHPIALQATKAFSPASIGKGYLRAMGVQPVLRRQSDFSPVVIGNAMSAFYGGRTGAHIRRVPVPVVYCDFLSMYPTVNALMDLWRFMIAKSIEVEDATDQVHRLLATVSKERLFNPSTWRKLPAFVQLEPDEDILPVRAAYDEGTRDWQVGSNYLKVGASGETLWYALPDVVASVLLTGKVPRIKHAVRLIPRGRQRGLRPVLLGGKVRVDPRRTDFFKTVIEERKRLSQRTDLTDEERSRLDQFLKILANATSYGILAEMVRHELPEGKTQRVEVYGVDDAPFSCVVSAPETPGEFCFPPIAALITSAARLQLALMERCVTDLGGTYAMEDTDSMAIVATEAGGLVPCPGGPYHLDDGRGAIKALSWTRVREITGTLETLNPYDRQAVPGSILKIEDDNFDPATGLQRQIYCFAISAKRYALFVYNDRDEPELLQKGVNNKTDGWSEHGLGHLLNPTNPDSDDRDWTRQAWLYLIREAHGLPVKQPGWFDRPAFSRITISSPAVLKPLATLNAGKRYGRQIKPFNFLISAHIALNGHPIGVQPDRFHLIAPYESDARKWERLAWTNQYSETGKQWRGTTLGNAGTRVAARLKTYGDVVGEYAYHPESKSSDASGAPCGRQTAGLLQRRHVLIGSLRHIGKESNRLEDVLGGAIVDPSKVYTDYVDPKRGSLLMRSLSIREIARKTGLARSTIQRIRNQHTTPRDRTLATLGKMNREVNSANRKSSVIDG